MADEINKVRASTGASEKAKTSQTQAQIKTSEIKKISKNGHITFNVELTNGKKGEVIRPYEKVLVDITNYLQNPTKLKAYYSQKSMKIVIEAYRRVNLFTPDQRKILEKKELDRQAGSSIAQTNIPSPGNPQNSLLKAEVPTEAEELKRISKAIANVDKNLTAKAETPEIKVLDYSSQKPEDAEKAVKVIFTNNSEGYDKYKAFNDLLPNIRHVLNKPNLNLTDVKQLYNNTKGTTQATYNKLRDALQLAVSKKLQNQKAPTDPLTTFFKSETGKEVLAKPGEIFMMTIAHLFAQSRKEKVKAEHITGAVKIYLATAKALAEQIQAKKS
jgi:hypothetical protein